MLVFMRQRGVAVASQREASGQQSLVAPGCSFTDPRTDYATEPAL